MSNTIDLIIIAAYLAFIVGLGLWMASFTLIILSMPCAPRAGPDSATTA